MENNLYVDRPVNLVGEKLIKVVGGLPDTIGEISELVNRIEVELSQLFENVNTLEAVLSPILKNDTENVDADPASIPVETRVGDLLSNIDQRTRSINRKIVNVTNRVAL
jgi:hypothetical protein